MITLKNFLLKLFILSLFINAANAQTTYPNKLPIVNSNQYVKYGYVGADSGYLFRSRDTSWRPSSPAVVVWNRPGIDTSLWLFNMISWKKVGSGAATGGAIDIDAISGTLNNYLLKTDTANTWLPKSFVEADPGSIHIKDTASIFFSFLRKADTARKFIPLGSLNIDGSFVQNSDALVPSQKAIKSYVDNSMSRVKTVDTAYRPGGTNILRYTKSTQVTDIDITPKFSDLIGANNNTIVHKGISQNTIDSKITSVQDGSGNITNYTVPLNYTAATEITRNGDTLANSGRGYLPYVYYNINENAGITDLYVGNGNSNAPEHREINITNSTASSVILHFIGSVLAPTINYQSQSTSSYLPTLSLGAGKTMKLVSYKHTNNFAIRWVLSGITDNNPVAITIPGGGTTGQTLVKQSNSDYDYSWATPTGGGSGGGGIVTETDPSVPSFLKNLTVSDTSRWNNKQNNLGFTPVAANAPLSLSGGSATGTKFTVDTKGLVTGVSTATTADIASALDKRYVTDVQLDTIRNIVDKRKNLSDLASAATARTNLGLANLVTQNTTNFGAGILKNGTTGTLSIATTSDFPVFNQNTTGTAANVTGVIKHTSLPTITGDVTVQKGAYDTTTVTAIKASVALTGSPTTTIPAYTDSTARIAPMAVVKKLIGDIGSLVLDTAGGSGINPIIAVDDHTLKTRALINANGYTLLRNTDSTYSLDFGSNLMTNGVQTFAGNKTFSDYVGIGSLYNTNYKLYVQSPNAAVGCFRTLNPSGGSLLLQSNTLPSGVGIKLMRLEFAINGQPVTAHIGAYAAQKFYADSALGTDIKVYTTPVNSTSATEAYRFTENGAVSNDGDNTDSTAIVDHSNSVLNDGRTAGELLPTVTQARRLAMSASDGLVVYQNDNTKGIYIYNKTTSTWSLVGSGASTGGSGYTMQGAMAASNLASNKPYYAGVFTAMSTSTAGLQVITVPKSGTIKKIYCMYYLANNTVPTATELSTIYLVQTPIATGVAGLVTIGSTNFNANGTDYYGKVSNSAMTTAVTEGDLLEVRIQTPTTANVLPQNMRFSFVIYIE